MLPRPFVRRRIRLVSRCLAACGQAADATAASTSQNIASVTRMNSGRTIPVLGLGAYLLDGNECDRACGWALEHGYRHIDTASVYENEVHVGRTLSRANSIPREQLFVTTKLWTPDHGRLALDACKISLKR